LLIRPDSREFAANPWSWACLAKVLLVVSFLAGCNSSQPDPQPAAAPAEPATINVDSSTAGSVTGTISFKGAAPKVPTLDMTQDPACPSERQPSEAIVLANSRLANVFIYVQSGLPEGRFPVPAEPVVLDQKGCRYLPHVIGIMAGQQLKVLNSDFAQHNVHPMPSSNPGWNESQMPSGEPIMRSFARPEMLLPVQCNQHPWMRAYLNVMSHPYFAVSTKDGTFTIKNLPPGEYTVAALHEKFGQQTMKVKVGAKETAKADFTFGAQ
jgi:hypothetical protein